MKEKEDLERLIGKQQIKLNYYDVLIQMLNEHYCEDVEKRFLKK